MKLAYTYTPKDHFIERIKKRQGIRVSVQTIENILDFLSEKDRSLITMTDVLKFYRSDMVKDKRFSFCDNEHALVRVLRMEEVQQFTQCQMDAMVNVFELISKLQKRIIPTRANSIQTDVTLMIYSGMYNHPIQELDITLENLFKFRHILLQLYETLNDNDNTILVDTLTKFKDIIQRELELIRLAEMSEFDGCLSD